MREFSRTMILTDADGDGIAQELLIQRTFCYPFRAGPGVDQSSPEYGPYTNAVKGFCNSRPVGTPAVYRYNETMEAMEQISNPYKNFWAGEKWTNSCCPNGAFSNSNDCNAISMVSGDFDDDQIADHILLYSSKMVFFFSSDRQRGTLPDNSQFIGLEIELPDYCSRGTSIHLVDMDNNGREEILVSCKNVAVYLVYSRGLNKIDWTLDNGCNGKAALGDLSNRLFHLPTIADMTEFCDSYSSIQNWDSKNSICADFVEDRSLSFTQSDGLSVIDINNDGFRDIVATSSFGQLQFYILKSKAPSANNKFISFRLVGDVVGSKSNYYGIGSTIVLFATDQNGTSVKQFREISSSQHHTDKYGSKDDRLVFGLGQHLTPKKIVVRWSHGFEQLVKLNSWSFSKYLKPIDIPDVKSKFLFNFTLEC